MFSKPVHSNHDNLLLELHDKEKIYGRGKQQRPPGAYLATNQIFSTE